jgi:hypothetical protein
MTDNIAAHGRRARMLGRGVIAICLLLLAGCTHDPLARAEVYPGLVEVEAPRGELVPVLFSAPDTPARQGFLYIGMYDAGVAGQNAGLARAAASLEEAKTDVGEVLYAVDPELAPPWLAKTTGVVELWQGSGYGLRRAVRNMIDEIRATLGEGSASPDLRTYGPRAIRCAENTLERADQVVLLTERALAAPSDAELDPILRELEQVAVALNNGVPSPDDEGCGLQQAHLYLNQIGVDVVEG